jgi:catechol 2,3-dioxygenase-like lactoylglutathione lyase family enzyme
MSGVIISGIQQIGIGVTNVREAWKWYREHFGMDVRVFEEEAQANLMLDYTGGVPRSRHAAMTINLQGGGGFEIWQYTDRIPEPPPFELHLGDLGIFAVKIKSKDVLATFERFKSHNLDLIGGIMHDPIGDDYFFVRDPYGNLFQVVEGNSWFRNEKKLTGAAYGVIVGTSNMELAKKFYATILGYDEVIYDKTEVFNDFSSIKGGNEKVRRVLLYHSKKRLGAFSRLFGTSYIELIESTERQPRKIFQGRLWGDLGFIHLCYDIKGMRNLKALCQNEGFPFTVDSEEDHDDNVFDMGEASGHFAYVEDPDGTLIEFVETVKLPLLKKLGISMDLSKRNPEKALPNWLLKALRFNKVKE